VVLVTSLSSIAWLLNLRGAHIPFNPSFQSYLFVSLSHVVLFINLGKVTDGVREYLDQLGV
jgi:Xaa-Pro aminopeptidase